MSDGSADGDEAFFLSCPGCDDPLDETERFAYGKQCGCLYHVSCSKKAKYCRIHGKESLVCAYNDKICVSCGKQGNMCPSCESYFVTHTEKYLAKQKSGTRLQHFYHESMRSVKWPAFFQAKVTPFDVDCITGQIDKTVHPLVRRTWELLYAVVKKMEVLHRTKTRNHTVLWHVGPYLERAYLTLPTDLHDITVITRLNAFKDIKKRPKTTLRLFRTYVRESKHTQIVLMSKTQIRRKTALSIYSPQSLLKALEGASYRGLSIKDVCQESRHGMRYIKQLGDAVVKYRGRLYADAPMRIIPQYATHQREVSLDL